MSHSSAQLSVPVNGPAQEADLDAEIRADQPGETLTFPFIVPSKSAAAEQAMDQTVQASIPEPVQAPKSHPKVFIERTDSYIYWQPSTRMTKPAGAPRPQSNTPLLEKAESPAIKNYWERGRQIKKDLDKFVKQVAEARGKKDQLTPAEYHEILFELIMESPGLYCLKEIDPKVQQLEWKNILVHSDSFIRCSTSCRSKITEARLEFNRYVADNYIEIGTEKYIEALQDFHCYREQCKAQALKQIFKENQSLFPNAYQQAKEIENAIFERDDQGNILPFDRPTIFGADERDKTYHKCLIKMVPARAKFIFFDFF